MGDFLRKCDFVLQNHRGVVGAAPYNGCTLNPNLRFKQFPDGGEFVAHFLPTGQQFIKNFCVGG